MRLAHTRISDQGGAILGALPNLVHLDLRETAIGDVTVGKLGKLAHLSSLNLFGTKVQDAGLSSLATCSSLRQLYVWQTDVSAQAVCDLQLKLPKARIVFAADLPQPAADSADRPRRRGGK
ncbi:MAG: hypothetical protein NT107_06480 [Planctomycetota bacterium]|nr:hypothetical protein [Planctomycetota bacterium]